MSLCLLVCGTWVGSKFWGWSNIRCLTYQYRKSHCGDKTNIRPPYLHNGISYSSKMISHYCIRALVLMIIVSRPIHTSDTHHCLDDAWERGSWRQITDLEGRLMGHWQQREEIVFNFCMTWGMTSHLLRHLFSCSPLSHIEDTKDSIIHSTEAFIMNI